MRQGRAPVFGAFFFLLAVFASALPAHGFRVVPDQKFATLPPLSGQGDIDLLLDLYLPEGSGPFPVLVMIYGGSYVTGQRTDGASLAADFARRGVAVAAIENRHGFVEDAGTETEAASAGLADVTAAFQWIRNSAARGLDADRVYVTGWSSGGHLSLAVGILYPQQNNRPVRLRGVLDLFGGFFSENLSASATPVLILQGTLDQACLPEASRKMASLLKGAGAWCRMILTEGMYHSWQGRWQPAIVDWGVEFVSWSAPGARWPEAGPERYVRSP